MLNKTERAEKDGERWIARGGGVPVASSETDKQQSWLQRWAAMDAHAAPVSASAVACGLLKWPLSSFDGKREGGDPVKIYRGLDSLKMDLMRERRTERRDQLTFSPEKNSEATNASFHHHCRR